MIECSECANELADDDRFCGECGAAAPEPPGRSEGPSLGELVPMRTILLRRYLTRAVAAMAALVVLSLVGGSIYYIFSSRAERGAIIRFALGERAQSLIAPEPEETPTPEASEEPTEEPSEQPTEAPSTEVASASATPAVSSDAVIQPGSWSFTMNLVNVTKANPSDTSFELNRQGIGASEVSSLCVTEAVAANPRAGTFPFQPGMDCRPSSLVMAANRYSGSMTCNFPQYGGRRPLDVTGQYSKDGISVTARVRVPADIVSGDFARPPEINLHYRITGRRTGSC